MTEQMPTNGKERYSPSIKIEQSEIPKGMDLLDFYIEVFKRLKSDSYLTREELEKFIRNNPNQPLNPGTFSVFLDGDSIIIHTDTPADHAGAEVLAKAVESAKNGTDFDIEEAWKQAESK